MAHIRPLAGLATAVGLVFVNGAAWYVLAAIDFSIGSARPVYNGPKLWIDRVSGGFLGFPGINSIADA